MILSEQKRMQERNEHLSKVANNLVILMCESIEQGLEPEAAFSEAIESLNEFENDFEAEEVEEAIVQEVGDWGPVSDNQAMAADKLHQWLTRNKKPGMPDMAVDKTGKPAQDEPGVMNLAARGQTATNKPVGPGGNPNGEMNLDPKQKDPFDNEWKRKLAALRIGNSSPLANATIESSQDFAREVRRLLESEVNEAEVLIAAKGFSQELQTIIEKLGRLQNEDLGPVTDRMKEVYGEQTGVEFYDKVNGEFQSLLDSMKSTRDNITGIIMAMAQGQTDVLHNDMGSPDDSLNGDVGAAVDAMDGPGLDDAGLDGVDEPIDDTFAGADSASGPEEEPLGRSKK
jgi:uncharacterized protein (UPF0335 family)